ncbi:hypothetical protein SAMN02746065_12833 [Desulfocicer vacuolatum DSM 3385]|uniref:Uncharacterized protein n=2 Tax=Desulfocicer vacuolatum TaxID=2298 RepID=A0A1W2EBY1_9BACT|nr:hypothetical protein SAMN02746065_12833 [Desulfocicer vacuolatum DSM 3385]
MEKNIKKEIKMSHDGKEQKQKGFFNRFLQWISRGTEKASRDGSFCNT